MNLIELTTLLSQVQRRLYSFNNCKWLATEAGVLNKASSWQALEKNIGLAIAYFKHFDQANKGA